MLPLLGLMLADISNILPHQERVSFECDVPSGRFSFWERQASGSNITVAGTIQPKELRPSTGWDPVANVTLLHGEKTMVGRLRVLASRDDRELSAWYQANPAEPGKGNLIGKFPKTALPITFSITLKDKALTLAVAAESVSTEVPETGVSRVQLACSSGDFRFQDIVITEAP
jgi:hypothetical protein